MPFQTACKVKCRGILNIFGVTYVAYHWKISGIRYVSHRYEIASL